MDSPAKGVHDESDLLLPTYNVIYTPQEEGGFLVTCPALPGLVTDGADLAEARAMAQDAIRGYLESLMIDREPLPVE
jgi:predicted RNase H-like HicB family nuclease